MAPDQKSLRERDEAERQRLWRLTGMGGTLTTEVLGGAVIGWLLDRLFDTKPTLLIVFTVGGVVFGMITFIRRAQRESHRLPAKFPPALPPDDGGKGEDDDSATEDNRP